MTVSPTAPEETAALIGNSQLDWPVVPVPEDAEQQTSDAIARLWVEAFLTAFQSDQVDPFYRIHDYRVEEIDIMREQTNSFTVLYTYSVLPVDDSNTVWLGGGGYRGEDGRVSNTLLIRLVLEDGVYRAN